MAVSFISEIKRRNVFKVGLAYVAVSWLLIQLVTTVEGPLGLPPWFDTLVIVLLAIGFPVALILAWAFELTPEGIKPTESVAPEASSTRRTRRWLNRITIGVLTVAVALLLIDRFILSARSDVMPNSVAVLPFENLSPDRGDAYFAPGLHEEILNRLEKIRNLTVIARTTMSQYKNTDESIAEIADELNVEAVMEGSVRFANDRVRVTAQLIDPNTGGEMWSDTYERPFDDVFAIESDVAMSVANALRIEFSVAEEERIEALPTESIEAYELYLAAQANFSAGRNDLALDSVDSAIALDEDFALAWALKSELHDARAQRSRLDQYAEQDEAMVKSAFRAFEIAPDLPEAQAVFAYALGRRGQWADADSVFRRAITSGNSSSVAYPYAVHLLTIGEFEHALEVLDASRRQDPLNGTVRAFYILALSLAGRLEEANEEFDRASHVLDNWLGPWFIVLARLGNENYSSPEWIPVFTPIHNEARQFLSSPEQGLKALRKNFEANDSPAVSNFIEYATWAAYFGDEQFALDAMKVLVPLNTHNAVFFWIPAMRDVRQEPRFKEIIREMGLVDYWNEFGWPDICGPVGADDFQCK